MEKTPCTYGFREKVSVGQLGEFRLEVIAAEVSGYDGANFPQDTIKGYHPSLKK